MAILSLSSLVTKWLAGNIETVFLLTKITPVKVSNSLIRSISSPKNSTRIPFHVDLLVRVPKHHP